MTLNFVFLGPAGSGKGTQSDFVANEYHLFHLSAGDLLREEVQLGTPLGKRIGEQIELGKLASNEVARRVICECLRKRPPREGVLFDGFPRNLQQVQDLKEICSEFEFEISAIFYFLMPLDSLIARVTGRRICEQCGKIYNLVSVPPKVDGVCDRCGQGLVQRDDDADLEAIKTRFSIYETATKPVLSEYADKVVTIRADQGKLKVFDDIKLAISALKLG